MRVVDKGNIFYVGCVSNFDQKVEKFFHDTNAFVELAQNPFNEILDKVVQLLRRLSSRKLILQWQERKMMPNRMKCQLSHLYFNPKTHKVETFFPVIFCVSIRLNLHRLAYLFDPLKIRFMLQPPRYRNFSIATYGRYSTISAVEQPSSMGLISSQNWGSMPRMAFSDHRHSFVHSIFETCIPCYLRKNRWTFSSNFSVNMDTQK